MGRRCGEGKAIFRGVAASCFLEEWGLQCHVPGGGASSAMLAWLCRIIITVMKRDFDAIPDR